MSDAVTRVLARVEDREAAGVLAIIGLQAMAGITETRESALAGWRKLSEAQRNQTMLAAWGMGVSTETEERLGETTKSR